MIKALAANTQPVYVGNDGTGDVSSSTGLQLSPGESIVLDGINSIGGLWVDAAVNGEGVSWIVLNV